MSSFVYNQFMSAVVSQQLSAAPDFLDAANNQLKLLAGHMNSKGLPTECVPLCSPYSDDTTGYGVVHPYHSNECLAIANPDLVEETTFVIFDCWGDIYTFPDIRAALTEFTHPFGHALWKDVMESGQGRKDYYFCKSQH